MKHVMWAFVALAAIPFSALAGNGAPSGAHFNLNLIGVAKGKSPNMTGGDGHRIFTLLSGQTKIGLSEGDFAVLDANGTDGSAKFQLPSPDPDGDGITAYSVYVRPVGKPGGTAAITSCATLDGEYVCSVDATVTVKRSAGASKFTNVSAQLLYVYVDVDGDGKIDKIPLFDDRLQDYTWQYDNTGLKILQMRFYEIPTNTN
jgi:hypothetical protein